MKGPHTHLKKTAKLVFTWGSKLSDIFQVENWYNRLRAGLQNEYCNQNENFGAYTSDFNNYLEAK